MSWIGVGVAGAARRKAPDDVGGQVVRRVVRVLVGDLRRDDRQRAALAGAKSASGSMVKVVGPPLAVAVWAPLVAHEIEYHEPVTLTGSLKVTETFAAVATSVASIPGERERDRRGGIGARVILRVARPSDR